VISTHTINVFAQWLSEHSHAIVLTLGALAFAAEAGMQWRSRRGSAHGHATAARSEYWLVTWRTNALLLAVTFALSKAVAPWVAPLATTLVHANVGALSLIEMPFALRIIIGMLLLDLAGYVMHRAAHRFGWWWRLHQVHHSDISYNASTHFRQHPFTFMVSLVFHVALLWALGIPLVSWVFYTLIANVHQLWQHAQMQLPAPLDQALRRFIVTQRFHQLHHHPDRALHDRNFGIMLPWWDRLFGTAHDAHAYARHQPNATGLAYINRQAALSLRACVCAPFVTHTHTPAIAQALQTTTKKITRTKLRPAHLRKSS
jgi:sterol desaturase/sphingolipid hydroxylase (fatty acid hydroxylase superfamily)